MLPLTRIKNPIAWQELCHQQRTTARRLSRLRLLAPLLIGLMFLCVALTLLNIDYPTRELGIIAIWIVHILAALRTLDAGANAISREHASQTWDALILTGVNARQILFGKWRAVLEHIAPWMLMLGAFRLAMIPVFLLALTNFYGSYVLRFGSYYAYYSSSSGYNALPPDVAWVPWSTFLAVVMSMVLTVLDVMCCAAIGLAASAVTRRTVSAMVGAIVVRFTPVILFAGLTRYDLGAEAANSYRVLRYAPFALADAGTAPLSRLSVPLTPLSMTTHVDALSGLFFSTLLLVVLLVISLNIAWIAIRRAGALSTKH